MSRTSSTPSPWRPNSVWSAAAAAWVLLAGSAEAQQVVYDPRNHLENALQASRQLQSLTNEARLLANQARQLAASPYSHLGETGQALRDISALADDVRGVAADVQALEGQFADLYPTAVNGLDPRRALEQGRNRARVARDTAEDLARTAARLEQMSAERGGRLRGALGASETAQGETAAVQSSNQILAVLSEDLAALRTLLAAQSRLMAEQAARAAVDRSTGQAARRAFYGRRPERVAAPVFNPFSRARP